MNEWINGRRKKLRYIVLIFFRDFGLESVGVVEDTSWSGWESGGGGGSRV